MDTEPDRQSPLADALKSDDVRSTVVAAVRRRVPREDAEDVAQAAFCEALDASSVPSNPLEIPFWLIGIARHAAVDHFRKRPREIRGESVEPTYDPPRFEVRQAVESTVERLGDGAKKTLLWMVMEREGIELQAIAREEKMSPAAVRARVYRLRRTLRRELAYLLCGLLVACGAGAGLVHWHMQGAVTVTAPESQPVPYVREQAAAPAPYVHEPAAPLPTAPLPAVSPTTTTSEPPTLAAPPAPRPSSPPVPTVAPRTQAAPVPNSSAWDTSRPPSPPSTRPRPTSAPGSSL